MIDPARLQALVATYDVHGWHLRRVVLSDAAGIVKELADKGVTVKRGAIDAAWFSRPPKSGPNAWEIRYLGPTEYALVVHIDENSPDFEELLHQTEERLADAVVSKQSA